MTWRIEVAANAAASSWTNITQYVDRSTARFGGQGSKFSVGTGSGFDWNDDAGGVYLAGRRAVRVIEDASGADVQIWRGRVSTKGLNRGERWDGDAKRYDVQLDDYNQDLWGIIVDGQDRPWEPAGTRMTWLINTYLDGQPGVGGRSGRSRKSTVLSDTYVAMTGLRTVPADEIFDGSPGQVASDILSTSGAEGFVTVDGEIFLDTPTSTAYAAAISITDDNADSITTFAPIPDGDAGTEDPTELLSGIKGKYGTGDHTSYSVRDIPTESTYDKWEEVIRTDTKSRAKAEARFDNMLARQKIEEKRRQCAIVMRADEVHKIKWGQTVAFQWAASGDLTPVTLRVARLMLELPAVDDDDARYTVHLELSFPKKMGASIGGGGAPGGNGGPAPYVPPSTPGIAAQAVLVAGTAVGTSEDATWFYPGGTPAGRLVTGRRYMLRMEVIYNRQIPDLSSPDDHYWDRSWGGLAGFVVASADNPTIGAVTGWEDATGLIDPNLDADAMTADGSPAHIIPNGLLIGSGSSFVTQWMTYTDPTVSIDLAMSGSVLSGIDGADTTVRLTLYEQTVDAAPVVPGSGGGPSSAQQINAEPGPPGDGVTTTGRTAFSYLAGSLRVHVNGLDWTLLISSSSPDSGDYTLKYAPPLGATVARYYQRGGTVASGSVGGGAGDGSGGTGGSPSVPPGPATSPELPDTPVNDGPSATPGDLQALIDAASENDVLVLDKMEWLEDFTVDTFGLTIDFQGGTINAESSRSMWGTIRAHNVTLLNVLMIDAAPDTPAAQKTPQLGSLSCDGWDRLTLRNVHLRSGRDMGLYLQHSANTTLVASSFNDNPRSGGSIGNVPNLRILDCQFNDNGTSSDLSYPMSNPALYWPYWEGGGYKIGGAGSTNILIERTEASGNAGVGQWIDEHPSNVTYRDCWGHHNGLSGLMYEISTGGSIIRWRGWENGWDDERGDVPPEWGWGADLLISSAGTVDVVDPIIAWSSAGITRINQGGRGNRESTVRLTGSGGVVACDDGRRVSSWHQDGSTNQILFTDLSNHENGLRWFCSSGEIFSWNGDITAAAFAATRGGVGLTELTGPEIIAILAAADIGGVAGVGMPTAGTH